MWQRVGVYKPFAFRRGSAIFSECQVLASSNPLKDECVVKLRLRDNESVQEAVKRFRKLVEHAGIKKEMRRREYYEKPSDERRRSRRRAERRARIARISGM